MNGVIRSFGKVTGNKLGERKMTLDDIKQNELVNIWIKQQEPLSRKILESILSIHKDILEEDALDKLIEMSNKGIYQSIHLMFDDEPTLNEYINSKIKFQEIDHQLIELNQGYMQSLLTPETIESMLKEEYR